MRHRSQRTGNWVNMLLYHPLCSLALFSALFMAASGWNAPERLRPHKDYALFFAVSQYQDSRLTDLSNSVKNAREIEAVLKDQYGFETEVVVDPKLDDIERKLEEYRRKFAGGALDKDGQLLIFFSGHGVKEYNNGYFLPADADPDRILRTGLPYNTWRPFISEINCKHILVAVDACYSVTFDPKWQSMGNPTFSRIGEMNEADRVLANHKEFPARIFFTSDSQEDIVPGRSNFARKFLEGLSKLQYKGTFVTSSELFANYIKLAQPAPRANEFEGDDPRSSFLFFPSEMVKADPRRFEQRQRDINVYAALQASPTISGCQQYLADFPEGNFRAEVTHLVLLLQEEQEWQFASLKNTEESYQAYQERFPGGRYVSEAAYRVKVIKSASQADESLKPIFGKRIFDPAQGNWIEIPDEMVFIRGGYFEMGDNFGDGSDDEKPVHIVSLSDFFLGTHEVTFDEYDAFCDATGYHRPSDYQGWGRGRRPVINVCWDDAIEYCNWRSRQENLQEVYVINGVEVVWRSNANGYRLPSEAEWEYAARSQGKKEPLTATLDGGGNDAYANFSGDDGYPYTAPVGSFPANSIGLHDMSGNVSEWCWDWYDEGYYEKSENSHDPRGPDSGSYHIIRGGSWEGFPTEGRCSNRSFDNREDYSSSLGFRLARNVVVMKN
ncbi:MAG: SUMF1/EgtB/PvdO family nonheme iron enzyme [Lewinellaceae bacterium]|nr:SUMF1/EgtB/PvdO family nonheme iron enzyme [Lewinellaceae bacterium]